MLRILIVEDDGGTRTLMEDVISDAGYEPVTARNGLEALEVMEHKHVDLIVLDVMLPYLDGCALTRQLRGSGIDTPILMVTAKSTLADKKEGFSLGADDYMVKPADEEELLLRIAALLRRAKIAAERHLTVGGTVLDYDSLTVSSNGRQIALPRKEFLLLYQLLSYNNKIFTRRQLMDELWDLDSSSDEHTVNVHINRLRERFRENPDFEIITVRGLGYKAVKR